MDQLVRLVLMVQTETLDLLATLDQLAHKAFKAMSVQLDRKVCKASKVLLVQLDLLAHKVKLAISDQLVQLDLRVQIAQWLVRLVQLVQLVRRAIKVSLDRLDRKAYRAIKAYKVFKVILDQLDLKASKVLSVRLVRLARLDQQELKVTLDRQDQQALTQQLLVRLVRQAHRARMVNRHLIINTKPIQTNFQVHRHRVMCIGITLHKYQQPILFSVI
jgi:hypothetical protein